MVSAAIKNADIEARTQRQGAADRRGAPRPPAEAHQAAPGIGRALRQGRRGPSLPPASAPRSPSSSRSCRSRSARPRSRAAIADAIKETGAAGAKDMGKVMAALKAALCRPHGFRQGERRGQGDARLTSAAARRLVSARPLRLAQYCQALAAEGPCGATADAFWPRPTRIRSSPIRGFHPTGSGASRALPRRRAPRTAPATGRRSLPRLPRRRFSMTCRSRRSATTACRAEFRQMRRAHAPRLVAIAGVFAVLTAQRDRPPRRCQVHDGSLGASADATASGAARGCASSRSPSAPQKTPRAPWWHGRCQPRHGRSVEAADRRPAAARLRPATASANPPQPAAPADVATQATPAPTRRRPPT